MSKYSEDAKIVDESTNIRLKELEVEKARIDARSANLPKYVEIVIAITIGLSITSVILGIAWFVYNYNVNQNVEITKRKQVQRDLDQIHVEQLRQVAEIIRNSNSDELALKALSEVQQ